MALLTENNEIRIWDIDNNQLISESFVSFHNAFFSEEQVCDNFTGLHWNSNNILAGITESGYITLWKLNES